MLLFVLLNGGDYSSGIPGFGSIVSHALAKKTAMTDFGYELLTIVTTFTGYDLDHRLDSWRNSLRTELRTNTSGQLGKRHPKIADAILDTFPDMAVVQLYLDPMASWSPRFTGEPPDTSLWIPREPLVPAIATFCRFHFRWDGDQLLKKFHANLWHGVAFRMLSSV
jgi:Holliday junction resolvase YEN1